MVSSMIYISANHIFSTGQISSEILSGLLFSPRGILFQNISICSLESESARELSGSLMLHKDSSIVHHAIPS